MTKKTITIPELSLVAMVGISSSGKSSFAKKHFLPTEIVSSDTCRGIVSNDENSLDATKDAFELVDYIVRKRLKNGLLTVIDATHVQQDSRKSIIKTARDYHCLPVAIVLKTPLDVCEQRHAERADRDFPARVLKNQFRQLRSTLRALKREGFRYIHVLDSIEEIDSIEVVRQPMWTDKKHETGPFDIIGDIHGCFDETHELLTKMGYDITEKDLSGKTGAYYDVSAPEGRKAFFVGDLIDRGPANVKVLKLAMSMVENGTALCIPGNHENKLLRHLRGRKVKLTHGLEVTVAELEQESDEFIEQLKRFIDGLISHFVLDDGNLVIAHAGMKEAYQGRGSGVVRSFALYGETSGEIDEYGLPVRYNWAKEYRGKALVVYGHTPMLEAEFFNNTICIDTGCVFGGKLTALRYPERELVYVPAKMEYYESIKPIEPIIPSAENANTNHDNPTTQQLTAQQLQDHFLHLEDVTGKRFINTRIGVVNTGTIKIEADRSASALEIMSRFAVHPKWINYLPPTMSPPTTSDIDDFLERPEQAFGYYESQGITHIICEEKHMGSRAIIQIAKDHASAQTAYGITTKEQGIIYTRSGRRFFNDITLEQAVLARLAQAIEKAGLWDKLDTDWLTLDCEIMPWSVKAMDLIKQQYASVGCTAKHYNDALVTQLTKAKQRGLAVDDLLTKATASTSNVQQFRDAYKNYCWDVTSIDDIKIAPFHIMASAGQVHIDKNHEWHMQTIASVAKHDAMLVATAYHVVDLTDESQKQHIIDWWLTHTQKLGEGMVVKPLDFVAKSQKEGKTGMVQPAIKVRGKEYLRIIYGVDYTEEHNLTRLRKRGLGRKRRLASNEFKLGIEALQRFVKKDPLRYVHESAFAVLAIQSEPVDPRL